jgi:hypothetical protein
MDLEKVQELENDETHQLIRFGLLNEQWCTAGTKEELAAHIIENWRASLGGYMADRYGVDEVVAELSTAVVCEGNENRRHYLFEAGNFSYT